MRNGYIENKLTRFDEKGDSLKRHKDLNRDLYARFNAIIAQNAADWFNKNNSETRKDLPYCLESTDWRKNIISERVIEYLNGCISIARSNEKAFPFHKHINSGKSSQALAFNLFGPIIVSNDFISLNALLAENGIIDEDICSVEFEYSDIVIFNEKRSPTSIDIVLKNSLDKPIVFIECKLTEDGFGGCSRYRDKKCNGMNPLNKSNECYWETRDIHYWRKVTEHSMTELLESIEICPFAKHYQFFREFLFSVANNGKFVLLYDQRNPVFNDKSEQGLIQHLMKLLPDNLKNIFHTITIQDVVKKIRQSNTHDDWIDEFCVKYGIENYASP